MCKSDLGAVFWLRNERGLADFKLSSFVWLSFLVGFGRDEDKPVSKRILHWNRWLLLHLKIGEAHHVEQRGLPCMCFSDSWHQVGVITCCPCATSHCDLHPPWWLLASSFAPEKGLCVLLVILLQDNLRWQNLCSTADGVRSKNHYFQIWSNILKLDLHWASLNPDSPLVLYTEVTDLEN